MLFYCHDVSFCEASRGNQGWRDNPVRALYSHTTGVVQGSYLVPWNLRNSELWSEVNKLVFPLI